MIRFLRKTVMQAATKPTLFFVLGGPGAGKGTQCNKLVQKYGFVHLSAGDLLRAERAKDTEHAKLIQEKIANGEIVPVKITVTLLKNAMKEHGWDKAKFLIDGFPRNQDNVDGWNEVVGEEADVLGILFFNCSEETMRQRLLKRGETSGRVDDNEAVILKRFNTYTKQTFPVIENYKKTGNVYDINAEGTPDEVEKEVDALLEKLGIAQI